METKKCTKCNITKEINEFYFRKDYQKYNTICKSCCRKKSKEYRENNKDYYTKYYYDNINYFKNYQKDWYINNKEHHVNYYNNYYNEHKEKLREKQREYYNNNKDIVKEYNKNYKNNKKHNNNVYKKQCYISSKIREVFNKKGNCNYYSLEDIIGISCKDLYNHLINTFNNNYGYEYNDTPVHIDHIKPLSTAKSIEDLIKLNHYTNLQLLKPEDNMKKWKHI